jgi:hypothetical protein
MASGGNNPSEFGNSYPFLTQEGVGGYTMRVDRLTSFEAETLIRFLLNHMGLDTRGKLMVELPVVYRKLLGRDVDESFRDSVKDVVLDKQPKVPPQFLVAVSRALGENGYITPRFWDKLGASTGAVNPELAEILENLEEDE